MSAQTGCSLGRGLSTPEERAKAIAVARELERDPLGSDAAAKRAWLLNWIIDVPDIRFSVCRGLLSPEVGDHYRYSTEVHQQVVFSAAAFKLEHPDRVRNDTGAYLAGVEGTLRAYEVLSKSSPDAKAAYLDDLLLKRENGALAGYLIERAEERCRPSRTPLFLNLGGAGVGLVLSLAVAHWFRRRPATENPAAVARNRVRLVSLCITYVVIVLTTLHILEPEFDPRFRFMSEYALGDYGWLMTTVFAALGLAPFVASLRLRAAQSQSARARIGLGLLLVAGIFIWLAGIFRDSLPHLLASVVVFPSIVMAVLLLSIHPVMRVIALALLALFASMVADVAMPGLQQRAFILLFLVWLSLHVRTPHLPSSTPRATPYSKI
jgi:hypothetical membrane protein